MKLSTKSRYALRAVIDLAISTADGHVPLRSIAARQNISENYLESMFAGLKRQGIVQSIKGQQGGYILARGPESITAGDIVRAMEGQLSVVEPFADKADETGIRAFLTEHLWNVMDDKINAYLDGVSIAELAQDYASRQSL